MVYSRFLKARFPKCTKAMIFSNTSPKAASGQHFSEIGWPMSAALRISTRTPLTPINSKRKNPFIAALWRDEINYNPFWTIRTCLTRCLLMRYGPWQHGMKNWKSVKQKQPAGCFFPPTRTSTRTEQCTARPSQTNRYRSFSKSIPSFGFFHRILIIFTRRFGVSLLQIMQDFFINRFIHIF